jgi:hypothetical protein
MTVMYITVYITVKLLVCLAASDRQTEGCTRMKTSAR